MATGAITVPIGNYGTMISVVIPTMGRETVVRTLRSIAGQTRLPKQLVVTKNGDFDLHTDVLPILTLLRERGVCVLILDNGPVGVQRARNAALARAICEFVTFVDDDDEFSPHRLEKFSIEWSDEASFLYTDDVRVTPSGRTIEVKRRDWVSLHDIIFENFVGNQVYTRTERLREVGGYDESLTAGQDYDLWIRLIHRFGAGRKILGGEQLIHWSGDSISANFEMRARGYLKVYFKHRQKVKLSRAERAWKVHYLRFFLGRPLHLANYLRMWAGRLPASVLYDATWFMYSRLRAGVRRRAKTMGRKPARYRPSPK